VLFRSLPAPPGAAAPEAVDEAKRQPLGTPKTGDLAVADAARLGTASADASTSAFHLGIGIAGLLMIAGGVVSGFGIENPRRKVEAFATRGSAAAGECGHAAGTTQPKQATDGEAPTPELA